ncbi:phospho-N-acetylmuramoyl-pentapeptide-transferase [Brachyspira intermedia]|uniref:phospho-N-acetylmuramoyl-pentapeptide- transferase n=1 Tax=Brachyspira intermedia TaxID=84377 RepID=UPI00300722FF
MLYQIFYPLRESFFGFNLFRYITFRTAGAVATALILVLLFAPNIIEKLKKLNFGQVVRDDGPETHLVKTGTPTMGGIFIVGSILISVLLWAELDNLKIILLTLSLLILSIAGFLDDFLKIKYKNSKGLPGKYKIFFQTFVGIIIGVYLYYFDKSTFLMTFELNQGIGVLEAVKVAQVPSSTIFLPFASTIYIDLKILYIPFATFVVVSMSNAVNLTDGLDGLAIGLLIIMSMALAVLSYVSGNSLIATYLKIPFISDAGEVTVFVGALIGAGLGFLWFNAHPAQVFMGDVGSLSLGGVLGIIALFIKHELLLVIIGAVYVAEALSVVLQVFSYKFFNKKRIFKMAPLHHHFEKSGWKETQVVFRFYIIGIIMALIGIATLKIR